ncbi:MAG: hypothetical protein J4G14_13870 [Dehalococcoidia bacterium]|nr:hypothetical protein [Dehalococcoidia bacterium]
MRSVRELYDLQLLDWEIQQREEELSEVQGRIADDSTRIQAHRRLSAIEAKLGELGPAIRQSERAVQEIEGRISNLDNRMYDGSVTNPREFEALQEERANQVRNRGGEEDRLLEFMVEIEEAEELRDRAKTAFEQIDAERSRELGTLETRREELTSEMPELHAKRQEISAEYAPNIMAVYETVRRTRGGQGAALVDQRGMCQGCRLTIPNAELSRARSSEGIVQCGSCTRILIYG